MGSTFDGPQIQKAKWFEKVPYTFLLPSLAAALPNYLCNIPSVRNVDSNKMAFLSSLAVTQEAGMYVELNEEGSNRRLASTAFPAALQPINESEDGGIRSYGRLGLALANNSGAPINVNLQTNFVGTVKQLTVADKVLRGIPLNTPYERDLQSRFKIARQGLRPLAISRMLQIAFKGQIIDELTYADVNPSSLVQTPIYNVGPAQNEILIIHRIAASATVGTNTQISINRDDDLNYVQIMADNMSLSQPLNVWIPVLHNLSVQLQATTPAAAVPVRLEMYRIKLSTLLQTAYGLLDPTQLGPDDKHLYDQVMAGVIA